MISEKIIAKSSFLWQIAKLLLLIEYMNSHMERQLGFIKRKTNKESKKKGWWKDE